MDTKALTVGTLVGGLAMYLLGYLIFELLFGGFYDANSAAGTAILRDAPIVWALALGTLALAALVTFVIGRGGTASVAEGFKVGAVVGFLVWLGTDLIHYAFQDLATLTLVIVDPLLEVVRTGLSGAVIAVVLGKTGGGPPAG